MNSRSQLTICIFLKTKFFGHAITFPFFTPLKGDRNGRFEAMWEKLSSRKTLSLLLYYIVTLI